jgi:hypothetical protein
MSQTNGIGFSKTGGAAKSVSKHFSKQSELEFLACHVSL